MRLVPDGAVHSWLQRQNSLDVFTTSVTEAEIILGVAILTDGKRKRDLEVAAQSIFGLFADRILPFDSSAARAFAVIVAGRRRVGQPIGDFDAQIAAITRSRGMSLATRNTKDFAQTGVAVINPWQGV